MSPCTCRIASVCQFDTLIIYECCWKWLADTQAHILRACLSCHALISILSRLPRSPTAQTKCQVSTHPKETAEMLRNRITYWVSGNLSQAEHSNSKTKTTMNLCVTQCVTRCTAPQCVSVAGVHGDALAQVHRGLSGSCEVVQ